MKTIIAGTRTIKDPIVLRHALSQCGWVGEISRVLCGDAEGVDLLGWQWAAVKGIPVDHYPARWEHYGQKAGPIRNSKMVMQADALLAVWDGLSAGTRDVIKKAEKRGLKVFVLRTKQ